MQATHVDIAVAWAKPCDAVDELEISAKNTKIRIAVGLSYNSTNPTTLDRLKEFADLRIGTSPSNGIFHPKYYCFRTPERTICWVGSANLTNGGFRSNAELVHEFEVKNKEDLKWFELLWKNLEPDPTEAITNYKENYTPPSRPPRPKPRKTYTKPELPSLVDIKTWADFVSGLQTLNDYCHDHKYPWDIFGETHSYLHTINVGREVVRLSNWRDLSQRECHILRGYNRNTDEGDWGLLGTLPMGGTPYVFNPANMPGVAQDRKRIQDQVDRVLNANSGDIADIAQNAMKAITNMRFKDPRHHIGPASATRWFTLARPDRLLSINSKSSDKLGELSGLPKTSLAKNYAELLNWLYTQPWFNSSQPNDPLEQDIWNCRAALLDAFIYVASEF
ncbi:MAG: phospholipase D family protein [Candidatus Dadabacteria bacterium]|nr:phospholipase D family protein [Candidatus Dadabacteria bacterium]